MDRQELERIFNSIDWDDFRRYLYRVYSRDHARNLFRYSRHVSDVLCDPPRLREFSPRVARYILDALGRLQDYLDLRGVELVVNYRRLRRYLPPRSMNIDVFEYIGGGRLIDQAVDQLVFNQGLRGFYRLAAFIAFYTGLRGPEIRYLVLNRDGLRKFIYSEGDLVIVELNYNRFKKKAYLTMMPRKLYEYIPVRDYVSRDIAKRLREKGVSLRLLRKTHKAILSRTMNDSEIDLLQGRLSRIIVRHYTREIFEIAEKYHKAYQPYYKLINHLEKTRLPKNTLKKDILVAGGGFEPPTYMLFYNGNEEV